MGFFDRIFGISDKDKLGSKTGQTASVLSFQEKDNLGLRINSYSQSTAYWTTRLVKQIDDPFIAYTFQTEDNARKALLTLPCMHIAKDSGNIICTEVLDFGVHEDPEAGPYVAFISGKGFDYDLYEQANARFSHFGGKEINKKEPVKTTKKVSGPGSTGLSQVTFVREDKEDGFGGIATYRIYKASSAESAKAFLKEQKVTKQLYYISVHTPEGNFGRDIEGIYQE